MADRPIIFSAPMILALLAGRKTQTRRILKPQPELMPGAADRFHLSNAHGGIVNATAEEVRQHGPDFSRIAVGDRLWVRENCQAHEMPSGEDGVLFPADEAWERIQAGSRGAADDWMTLYHYGRRRGAVVPSIHMPRWASRLTLIVTEVRVERLQDISEAEAVAEGIRPFMASGSYLTPHFRDGKMRPGASAYELFSRLWNDIHGPDAWAANPWVVAVSFTVHARNIDQIAPADALDIAGAA